VCRKSSVGRRSRIDRLYAARHRDRLRGTDRSILPPRVKLPKGTAPIHKDWGTGAVRKLPEDPGTRPRNLGGPLQDRGSAMLSTSSNRKPGSPEWIRTLARAVDSPPRTHFYSRNTVNVSPFKWMQQSRKAIAALKLETALGAALLLLVAGAASGRQGARPK
jgi:hypothetical protein